MALMNNELILIFNSSNYKIHKIFEECDYMIFPHSKPKALLLLGKIDANMRVRIHILPRHVIEIERYFSNHHGTFLHSIEQKKKLREKKREEEAEALLEQQRKREEEKREQEAKALLEQRRIKEEEKREQNRRKFLKDINQKINDLEEHSYFRTLITNYITQANLSYLTNISSFVQINRKLNDMLYNFDWLSGDNSTITDKNLDLDTYFFGQHNQLMKLLFHRSLIENKVEWYFIFWHFYKKIGLEYLLKGFLQDYVPYISDNSKQSLDNFISEFVNIQTNNILDERNTVILTKYLEEINLLDSNSNFKTNIDIIQNKVKETIETNSLNLFESQLLNIQNQPHISMDDIDMMTGIEFEEFVASLFEKMGYQSIVTKKSGDQGIDVIVNKNEVKTGIQTKCYAKDISNSAIQEVVAGIKYHNLNKGMVITNRYFTNSAIRLAESNQIILWDRVILKDKIKLYYK